MSKAHHSSLRSRLGAPQGWRRVAASVVHKDAMSRLQELKRFGKKYKLEVDKAAENDRKAQDAMAQPRKREKERARAVQETQLYVDQVPKECLDRDGIPSQSSLLKGIPQPVGVLLPHSVGVRAGEDDKAKTAQMVLGTRRRRPVAAVCPPLQRGTAVHRASSTTSTTRP